MCNLSSGQFVRCLTETMITLTEGRRKVSKNPTSRFGSREGETWPPTEHFEKAKCGRPVTPQRRPQRLAHSATQRRTLRLREGPVGEWPFGTSLAADSTHTGTPSSSLGGGMKSCAASRWIKPEAVFVFEKNNDNSSGGKQNLFISEHDVRSETVWDCEA